jgi:uncharacterized protein YndB with AHSA1/START domain/effector-binding domain-containing protein
MKDPRMLTVEARGDREIVMVRAFNAPRPLVFDAFTKPDLVRRWLLGPDGWTMPVCEIDLRVGGKYRYEWRKESTGTSMAVGGVFREVTPPARVVHTERFDEAWYEGEAVITTEFVETAAGTSVTMTMLMASREARDGVLKSGMEGGVARSYDRLEAEILDAPAVVRTEARDAAVIRLTIPRADMPTVMGPAIGEILGALGAQGVAPAGPVFAHHLKMDPGTFDFEVGVPVASPVAPSGRVRPGALPAARVARKVYTGPYEGLHGAWGEFDAWMRAHSLAPAPDLWEVYAVGPESVPDPASYRTELNRPLAG